jgi:copper chaperone CopZ
MRRSVLLFGLMLVLAGCQGNAETSNPPPEPMPTTGPGEVVLYVPTMVCESCPQKVAEALALLPWVDAASIQPDRKLRQVRFRVTDRAAFDLQAVKESVAKKGFKDVKLLTGPTA